MPDPIKTLYDAASAVETPLGSLEDTLTALDLWYENMAREAPASEPVENWMAILFVARFHKYLVQYQILLSAFRTQLDALRTADNAIYEVAFKARKEKEGTPDA